MLTLKDESSSKSSFDNMLSRLERTGAPEGVVQGKNRLSLLRYLSSDPSELRAVAIDWESIAEGIPVAAAPPSSTTVAPLPAQTEWIRGAGRSLAQFPALEKAIGITGAELTTYVDGDLYARTIQLEAGKCKDGAMDLRAITGSYGWFQVCTVLDWLRENTADCSEAEAHALLDPFTPMFVVLLTAAEERADHQAALKKTRATTAADAEAAQAAARMAQILADYRAGKTVSRSAMLELAQAHAATSLQDALDTTYTDDSRPAPKPTSKRAATSRRSPR